jgi:uncharacterized protein YukE
MKSYTKIRQMQELNKLAEKRFIQESRKKVDLINEGWWAKLKANTVGFFNRFKTFGQNLGSTFAGGVQLNPNLEAAYARVRTRAQQTQNQLEGLESDLAILFDEANKEKIEKRADKLGATRGGQDIQNRLQKLEQGMEAYSQAIEQLKGINEGFLETVKVA